PPCVNRFLQSNQTLGFLLRCLRNPVSASADAYFTDPMPAWQVLFVTFCEFGQNTARQKRQRPRAAGVSAA
ncbi:MAG: hypothetical protein VX950_03070, partial [Pseudomonadota bacterium]|nr:hypothetical protein [Pseudomonadota bacterium]